MIQMGVFQQPARIIPRAWYNRLFSHPFRLPCPYLFSKPLIHKLTVLPLHRKPGNPGFWGTASRKSFLKLVVE
jgi:hypothetical protein